MTVFILNLASADLTYCLINLPIDVLQKLQYRWKWSLPVCQFVANIRYSNAYADWMSLAMIAFCLCYKVTKPRKETIFSSTRNRIFILVFIRMYGFILLIPTNLRVKTYIQILYLPNIYYLVNQFLSWKIVFFRFLVNLDSKKMTLNCIVLFNLEH